MSLHSGNVMKNRTILLLSLFIFLIPSVSHTLDIRFEGEKFSTNVVQAPLQDILRHFADYGIKVFIDPQINPKLSVSFTSLNLQQGLAAILKSQNYVLIWQNINAPSGVVSKLTEIQVFHPGKKERMQSIGTGVERALVRRISDGALYVKKEILVRVNPNISFGEFENLLEQIGAVILDRDETVGIHKITLPDNVSAQSALVTITKNPAAYPSVIGVGALGLDGKPWEKSNYLAIHPQASTEEIINVFQQTQG